MKPQTITLHRFWWMNGGTRRYAFDAACDWAAEQVEPHGWQENASTEAPHGFDSADFPLSVVSTKDQAVLFLVEEYGYRHWVWWTGMSAKDLTSFWSTLPSVAPHFIDPSKTLPGEFREVTRHGNGIYSDASNGKPTNVIQLKEPFWKGHLHMDEDSYLVSPDGERLLHQGAHHPSTSPSE